MVKVYLHEFKETETQYHFTEKDKWVLDTVQSLDENDELVQARLRPQSKVKPVTPAPRATTLDFTTRKVDDVFLVQGLLKTSLKLLCSRCAAPFEYPVKYKFSTVYTTETEEDLENSQKNSDISTKAHFSKTNQGRNGYARHAHDWGDEDPNEPSYRHTSLETETIDTCPFTKDFIDLEEILAEQLQLQVPFQPLCRSECKGICPHCGADQNTGRCACDKLVKETPFSVLKDFPVKRTTKP